jgi:thiol-disulfide isomerase/thioredoxin
MKQRTHAQIALVAYAAAGFLALSSLAAAQAVSKPAAAAFKAVDMEGKDRSFPSDYKGRIVMLDFWATWCPPCVGEVPGIVSAYAKYHARGFDILGISLDQANSAGKVKAFEKQYGMTWPQVYDGKYWEARVARFYGIDSIPRAFLVDGDTGVVLASGDAIRGESLAPAIEKALASKKL